MGAIYLNAIKEILKKMKQRTYLLCWNIILSVFCQPLRALYLHTACAHVVIASVLKEFPPETSPLSDYVAVLLRRYTECLFSTIMIDMWLYLTVFVEPPDRDPRGGSAVLCEVYPV